MSSIVAKKSIKEDWDSSDIGIAMRAMWQVINDEFNGHVIPESINGASLEVALQFHKQMGYSNIDDAQNALKSSFMRRPDGVAKNKMAKELVETKKLKEHVSTQDSWEDNGHKFSIVHNFLGTHNEPNKATDVFLSHQPPGEKETLHKVGTFKSESEIGKYTTAAHEMAKNLVNPPPKKKKGVFDIFKKKVTEASPYAIGMLRAKKEAGVTRHSNIPKAVITRAHKIADSIKNGPHRDSISEAERRVSLIQKKMKIFEEAFNAHKRDFAKQLREGTETDLLGIGYGLRGEYILSKAAHISKLEETAIKDLRNCTKVALSDFINYERTQTEISTLNETKTSNPYGVIYTKDGIRVGKFFETARHRNYWVKLNEGLIDPIKVNPIHIDAVIDVLSTHRGK